MGVKDRERHKLIENAGRVRLEEYTAESQEETAEKKAEQRQGDETHLGSTRQTSNDTRESSGGTELEDVLVLDKFVVLDDVSCKDAGGVPEVLAYAPEGGCDRQ